MYQKSNTDHARFEVLTTVMMSLVQCYALLLCERLLMFQSTVMPSLCKVISHILQDKSNTILQIVRNHFPAIMFHSIGFATDDIL
jgi:hypothetical protein